MSTLDTLQAKRDEANKIVLEIANSSNEAEKKLIEAVKLVGKIEVKSNDANKLRASLKSLIDKTEETINKFRTERNRVSSLLTKINNFYDNKYIPLVEKIEDKDSGLKSVLTFSEKTRRNIDEIKKQAELSFNEVKSIALDLKDKNKQLIPIDSSIRKLLNQSREKKIRIDTLHTSIIEINEKVKHFGQDIDKIFRESEELKNKISNLLNESNIEFESIKEIRENSSDLLTEIMGIYGIASDTALSGEFDKRRSQLQELLNKWENRIIAVTLISLVLIILMFFWQLWMYDWDIKSQTFNINFYIRFLILSPLIYLLYFFSSEYSQTKKLHDKYSFKTTLAMSIKQHFYLLLKEEKFTETERIDKILNFILEGFQKIYSEPYSIDDFKLKLKLSSIEMDLEKRILKRLSQEAK